MSTMGGGAFASLVRYARTARALRPRQLAYWVIRRAQGMLPPRASATRIAAGWDRSNWTAMRGALSSIAPGPDELPAHVRRAEAVIAGDFVFLGERRHFDRIDWRARHVSHLWTFHLHYFDYLLDLVWAFRSTRDDRYRAALVRLIDSWIAATGDRRGDGWQPYPLSVRLINWSIALVLLDADLDAEFVDRAMRSVVTQFAVLERRVEWHLLANHVQKNHTALVVASLAIGTPARDIRERASRALLRDLEEQVLPDGGHFERTPMYHAIVLHDFLLAALLLTVMGDRIPSPVAQMLSRMCAAYSALCRADGSLYLFNDSAQHHAPSRVEIARLTRRVVAGSITTPRGEWSLPYMGFFGVHDEARGDALVIDCGPPGAPYQPAHAHCDALSYELYFGGRPVVVDSGVHGYEGSPFREYVRSTRAHNTLMVDGEEQSEMWSTFRMARGAQVWGGTWNAHDAGHSFTGRCRTYRGRARQDRRIVLDAAGLHVEDSLHETGGELVVESFIHLHPDFEATIEGRAIVAVAGATRVRIETFGFREITLLRAGEEPVQGWYCPQFGMAIPQTVIAMAGKAMSGQTIGYHILRA